MITSIENQSILDKKAKKKVKAKIYQQANKDKLKANREINKDKIKAYREANKDKAKAYREANRDAVKAYNKAYQKTNKDKLKANREINKDKIKAYSKAYCEANKDERKVKAKIYQQANPIPAFVRRSLQRIFSNWRGSRKESEILHGYTYEQLINHIKSLFLDGMSWENRSEWHIDHIKPISIFIKEGVSDPSIINALSNLQPLWVCDNLSKGATYDSK